MKIIDLHCDTMYRLYKRESKNLAENDMHIDLKKMQAADSWIQTFAVFDSKQRFHYDYDHLKKFITIAQSIIYNNKDQITFLENINDVADSQMHALLSLEDGGSIRGKINRLNELYNLGIRMIAPTWNHENCFGYPNTTDADGMSKGLKPFGIEAISRMNDLGMIIDVSHLSDGGFWDVATHSKKPIIASHSNARRIKAHPRNLTDDMIKKIADMGGVIGINFYSLFLSDDPVSKINAIIKHIDHIKHVGGIEVLAIGSDYDGIRCDLEMSDISKVPLLFDALRSVGFSERKIECIANKNALRVFQDCLK